MLPVSCVSSVCAMSVVASRLSLICPARLLQLCGSDGRFHVIRHDLNYTFSLSWDPAVMPSALVHVSNCGRSYFPWNGTHASVTVSPVLSAFDLGTNVSVAENPLRMRGVDTCLELVEGRPATLRYSLSGGVTWCWDATRSSVLVCGFGVGPSALFVTVLVVGACACVTATAGVVPPSSSASVIDPLFSLEVDEDPLI